MRNDIGIDEQDLKRLAKELSKLLVADARSRLFRRRTELSRLYARHNEQEHSLDTADEPDWPDRAALHADDEVLHRLSDHERVELGEIDAALERIAQGRYGMCESCGGEISPARLAVLPQARRCIDCQV